MVESLADPVTLTPELLRRARARERAAFNEVGDWISDALFDFYRLHPIKPDELAELRQRAAVELVAKFDDAPEDPELFRQWVTGFAVIAVKKHRSLSIRHQRKRAVAHSYPRTPARRPDSQLAAQELVAWARDELRKLRSPYRSTFMRMLEGEDTTEIADGLEAARGTVRRRLWEVRATLRAAFDRARRTSQRYRT